MKRMLRLNTLLICTALLSPAPALAGVGASVKVGTLGVGADVTVGILSQLNARVGLGAFRVNDLGGGEEGEDNQLTFSFGLLTVAGLLDWHPFAGGGFRLSGGLVYNGSKIDMEADTSRPVSFSSDDEADGGEEFLITDLQGKVDFKKVAPYLGIGYGNAVAADGRLHFSFDLGAAFQGAPRVAIDAVAANPADQARLDAATAERAADIEENLSIVKIFPVLAFGMSYRF